MATRPDPDAVPTRLLVVGPPSPRRRAVELLRSVARPLTREPLRLDEADLPTTAESWTRALRGIDQVLVVSGTGPDPDPDEVADAIAALRRDPSTAAVGAAPMAVDAGALQLAVSGEALVLRASALQMMAAPPSPLDAPLADLELCATLWLAGHRVRALGRPRPLLAQDAGETVVRGAVLRVLARCLEPHDLEVGVWGNDAARQALDAVRAAPSVARARGTAELGLLLHGFVGSWVAAGGPAVAVEVLTSHGAPARTAERRRVLILTTDVVAPQMAGPAIRALAIARTLGRDHEVRLRTTARCELRDGLVDVDHSSEADLRDEVDWADIVVFQGWVMAGRPWLRETHKILVADAYDPMHLEQLEQGLDAPGPLGRTEAVRETTSVLNEQLGRADLILCAGTRQRDLWLGALAALGRVNPATYEDDPNLDRLLAQVPFGIPEEPLPEVPGAIKGRVRGIGSEDQVVLWGGGVYNWFDPVTLVRAIDRLRTELPNIRLFFMGMVHPNPGVPTMRVAGELRAVSAELGLTDRHVFFNDGWVPYESRAGYFRDADVAVSTHVDHVETAFSFRTRILDYLWADLPIVATGGDAFAELLERTGAGLTVPPGDVEALADALRRALQDPTVRAQARAGSAVLRAELAWSRAVAPLAQLCRDPRRAPDVACPGLDTSPESVVFERGVLADLRKARAYLRSGGLALLTRRVRARTRRLLAERGHR